jgi:putative transposase
LELTYIPMARGFVYLCAVVDWSSGRVLSWRLSITMEADFLSTRSRKRGLFGKPDVFNTVQGSQFTSIDFTVVLKKAEIFVSMHSKGAWRDNVFVERL